MSQNRLKLFKQTFYLNIDNTKGAMREHDSIAIAAFKGLIGMI